MDPDRARRTNEAISFFKNKFKLNIETYSAKKTRYVVDELNRRLDKALEEERRRNMYLTEQIYTERNRIMALTQELYG